MDIALGEDAQEDAEVGVTTIWSKNQHINISWPQLLR